MPKVVITHSVADVDTWLKFKAERAEAIGALGGTNVVDHVDRAGGTAAVSADVADVEALTAALSAPPPEVAELMQSHGVQPPLTIFVEG